ncbi:MAG: hypothetical protein IKS59_06050, partial [Aeriscardovia sp.]|nr:hypothetical protein [Aeriscardovia sp.]
CAALCDVNRSATYSSSTVFYEVVCILHIIESVVNTHSFDFDCIIMRNAPIKKTVDKRLEF